VATSTIGLGWVVWIFSLKEVDGTMFVPASRTYVCGASLGSIGPDTCYRLAVGRLGDVQYRRPCWHDESHCRSYMCVVSCHIDGGFGLCGEFF
jgi:hypothetical protein